MKRAGRLIQQITEPDNLRLAFWKAQRGKSYARAVQNYRQHLEQELLLLRAEMLSGEVKVGDYHFFTIYDPKEREICALAFREQVLHHALMNICHFFFERKQIFDSYASRKGKGTDAALKRARLYNRKYDFYLKLDIRKFFGSIHHEVLKVQLERLFKDQLLLDIFFKIIGSHNSEEERGLPIGNLTSQYFANHYLSGLDHYIKEQLGCKAYVRYMDDMVLWGNDKRALMTMGEFIKAYLAKELSLELKTRFLNKTGKGLPFLGYLIFKHHIHLSQRSKKRFIQKTQRLQVNYWSGTLDEAACQRKVLPLLAFTLRADTKKFRKNVLLKNKAFHQRDL